MFCSHLKNLQIDVQFQVCPVSEAAAYDWIDLTDFQKLILVKVLRPDAFISAVRHCVRKSLGDSYVTGVQLDMKEIYSQATHCTPLIFLLSPGLFK